jgi:hypothetical protein
MKTYFHQIGTTFFLMASFLFILSCADLSKKDIEVLENSNSKYEIASEDYETLAEQALNHVGNFEFEAWFEMLSEDVEYYFPDGDAETRTKLIGKKAVMEFWNNYPEESGNDKMTFSNFVHVPIDVKQRLNYTGLTGIMVISYFSAELVFSDKSTNIRMNFAAHFNEDKLIDKYYTYYDRTPIIETIESNILENE